jgi:hypothetical protein
MAADDTYIRLKDHLDEVLRLRDQRLDDRFEAQLVALDEAKKHLERRLEALNELRSAVERDRAQFVKQEVYDTKTNYYDAWCRGVDKKLAYWSGAIVVIVFLIEIVMRFIK